MIFYSNIRKLIHHSPTLNFSFLIYKMETTQIQEVLVRIGGSVVKNLPANAGDIRDMGSIPGSGRSAGGEHSNTLQYSCLENPRDKGAWRAPVHRGAKSRTQVKRLSMHRLELQRSRWSLPFSPLLARSTTSKHYAEKEYGKNCGENDEHCLQ